MAISIGHPTLMSSEVPLLRPIDGDDDQAYIVPLMFKSAQSLINRAFPPWS
jgi:hypothetical protein